MISPEQIFASVNYTTSEKAEGSIAVQDSGKCVPDDKKVSDKSKQIVPYYNYGRYSISCPTSIWWFFLSKWTRGSMDKLAQAEAKLLKRVKSYKYSRFVDVRYRNSSIYTITVKPQEDTPESEIPFVLIPGFAAGSAVWASNFDAMAEKRTVHAFDILGFGHSDRPDFSNNPTLAELEMMQSIEDWRKKMGLDKMLLVGHSFGAFLAASYTLDYPTHVRHLVLIDPVLFEEHPETAPKPHIPFYLRVFTSLLSKLNPFAPLRFAGPYGTTLVRLTRSDLLTRYPSEEDPDAIFDYVYQCCAQNPTGEVAFKAMTMHYGWARRPMVRRFISTHPSIPCTFIYGAKTYISTKPANEIMDKRPNSYVDLQIVTGAGHHVYADMPEQFNELMRNISDLVDHKEDAPSTPTPSHTSDRVKIKFPTVEEDQLKV